MLVMLSCRLTSYIRGGGMQFHHLRLGQYGATRRRPSLCGFRLGLVTSSAKAFRLSSKFTTTINAGGVDVIPAFWPGLTNAVGWR